MRFEERKKYVKKGRKELKFVTTLIEQIYLFPYLILSVVDEKSEK